MTWNLDQIERELREGDPCNQRPECFIRDNDGCDGRCARLTAWLNQSIRLPGALIRHLLGARTERHGDLWDRAVGAVTRAETSRWRHGATDWRTDGLVLVERGVVLGLVEERRAKEIFKWFGERYRDLAHEAFSPPKPIGGIDWGYAEQSDPQIWVACRHCTTMLNFTDNPKTVVCECGAGYKHRGNKVYTYVRPEVLADVELDDKSPQPKPMRKCTEPHENLTPEYKEALRKAYPVTDNVDEQGSVARTEYGNGLTVYQHQHPRCSRAAIEAAVNSVEGARFVEIGDSGLGPILILASAADRATHERVLDVLKQTMPADRDWSLESW